MARSSDSTKRKSRSPSTGQPAPAAESPANANIGSALFIGPMRVSTYLLQFVEQMERLESVEADQVRAGAVPRELLSLQPGLAAAELARFAQMAEQMYLGLLDAQTSWITDASSYVETLMRPWLANDVSLAGSAASGIFDVPANVTPAGLLQAAQTAWTEMTGAWLSGAAFDPKALQTRPTKRPESAAATA